MRTHTFFDNVDATINQTSTPYVIECGQDMRWLLEIVKTGTDGNPKLYIDVDVDGNYMSLEDIDGSKKDYFLIDQTPYGIQDSYFMGKSMRLRLEPNGNTTGTMTINASIKTKSV